MKRKRRKFTKEFKEEAVKLVLERLSDIGILVFTQTYSEGGNMNMEMEQKMVLEVSSQSDFKTTVIFLVFYCSF